MTAVYCWPLAMMLLALPCCGPAATDGGFDSANPAAKMYAIERAARDHDLSAIKSIIEQLDSDDPAVRCLAISALRRLTGETYGYRDFDPPQQRRQAIGRWVEAFQAGQIQAATPAADPSAERSGQDQIEDASNHG